MDSAGYDGHARTGTFWSGLAHAVTAIVGTGILAIPWSVSQLGWIVGPIALLLFAAVSTFTAHLLTDCYRVRATGRRNRTYREAVRNMLGNKQVVLCASFQYLLLWGTMVSYTITAAMSFTSVVDSACYHRRGHGGAGCKRPPTNAYMFIYGAIQIILSQLPNLEEVTFLSAAAALTSVGYSLIALALAIAKFSADPGFRGSLTLLAMAAGTTSTIPFPVRIWNLFQALGNIAFAYTYAMVLLEIQDTLKTPPLETKTMKKITNWAMAGTASFYVSLGIVGYAAFGNHVPGNILTGGFKPFWITDIADVAVVIHLVTAYQVFAQPLYDAIEGYLANNFPTTDFFTKPYAIQVPCTKANKKIHFTLCKLLMRTLFVALTTAIAMGIPYFNSVVGFLGSISFWPLTIHFPIKMYVAQERIGRWTRSWCLLQALDICCFCITICAAVGSTADILDQLRANVEPNP